MDLEKTKKFSSGLFQQGRLIAKYLMDIKLNALDGIIGEKTNRENSILGLFLRAVCFSHTISKCDNVKDFQTLAHAERGLMEILTDLVLLHHDKTDVSLQKMENWEESYRLKSAEKVVAHFQAQRVPVPQHCKAQEEFVSLHECRINNLRLQHGWKNGNGNPAHPSKRWTGNDLGTDIKRVDQFETEIKLSNLYELEYTRMNWFVHGSGLTGMRLIEEAGFYRLYGLTHAECGRLELECARITLKEFQFFKAGYQQTWEQRKKDILFHIASFLP